MQFAEDATSIPGMRVPEEVEETLLRQCATIRRQFGNGSVVTGAG